MNSKDVDVVSLRGGLDFASTVLKVYPGAALGLTNFEPELEGGYRRVNGYERKDGRVAPSDAVYYTVGVADGSGISVDDTLTGDSSGATSRVVVKDGNTLGVTLLVGTYTLSEAANSTTITAVQLQGGQTDPDTDDIWLLAAADYYRSLITVMTGTGNALYGFELGGVTYGFRESGGTVVMYKSSASGWAVVPFFDYIFFDAGTLADGDIVAGTVIDGVTSSAQGTVKKFVKNAGSYGSTASGYMVVDVTTGTFQDNEKIAVSAVNKCDADGANVAIALATGGTFQHVEHNFYGDSGTRYIYGCDGINPAWEFDGTTLAPIYYPAPTQDPAWNAPTFIKGHKSHLFLMYAGGQMSHSSIGEPLVFSALMGAGTFGLGSDCTGMESRAGSVLALYTRNHTYGLYGSDSSDWTMTLISETFGARPYTVQAVSTIYALDDKGIAPLDRVQAYGDFEGATVSRMVKPLLDSLSSLLVTSITVKDRNQYRLFYSDGTVIVMGDDGYLGDALPSFSTLKYPDVPTFVSSSEAADGSEVILFGDSTGMIYQAEIGYNFDGAAIEWSYRTPFMHQGSPQLLKSYRKAYIDIDAPRPFSLRMSFDLDFHNRYAAPNNAISGVAFSGGGGYYDIDNWDDIFWDAEVFSARGVDLAGSGKNISLLFYGNSKYIRPFTIETVEVHYFKRRLKRGK